MRQYKKWNPDEDQYIKDNPKKPNNHIAFHLRRTTKSVAMRKIALNKVEKTDHR